MTAPAPRVALLGAGRMGQAIITGLRSAGWDAARIVAVEPHAETAAAVRAAHGVEVLTAEQAVADADVVVVAVKPHQVGALLDEVAAHLAAGATVVSLAAGVSTTALAAHLPAGTAIVRVMPNTPALVGAGMSVLSPGAGCPPEAVALAREVLGAVGAVREVPESAQDAVTAVSGSGPAYVFYLAEAMIDAGVLLGLPRPLAHDLTVSTLLGAATMLDRTGEHPTVLRENVTSPGGTTAAAIHALDAAAVRAAVGDAMRACRDRSRQLAGD
jgi:pyrroline-5-carboxylate reductase